ncbi:MAG: class B sortase [Firmicutes bacterium]|nr:class B sortase [Bacillota bacterium]
MVKKKKKWSVTNIILTGLIVVLLGVVGFSGYKLFVMYQKYHHNTVSQNKVSEVFYGQQTVVEQEAQEGSEVTPTQAKENKITQEAYSLSPLVAQNPDTVGWINIPDTVVDFAVMHAADNDYYLHRDFFREYNYAGIPFLDATNTPGAKRQNYIIYGHRMKDKSMFWIIGEYLEQDWYEQHKNFTLLMRVGKEDIMYDCEVFAVYRLTTFVDAWQTVFATDDDYARYIQACYDRSVIKTDVVVSADTDEQILTLSTCDSLLHPSEGRLLVHAKMIERSRTPVQMPAEPAQESSQESSQE